MPICSWIFCHMIITQSSALPFVNSHRIHKGLTLHFQHNMSPVIIKKVNVIIKATAVTINNMNQ